MPACHILLWNSSPLPPRHGAVPLPPSAPHCIFSWASPWRLQQPSDSRCSNVGGNCSHAQLLRTQPFMVFLEWKLWWFVALCLLSCRSLRETELMLPRGFRTPQRGAHEGDKQAKARLHGHPRPGMLTDAARSAQHALSSPAAPICSAAHWGAPAPTNSKPDVRVGHGCELPCGHLNYCCLAF